MFDEQIPPGELLGNKKNKEPSAEDIARADIWMEAMDGINNNQIQGTETLELDTIESATEQGDDYGNASNLAGYGFDTVSEICGLESVLDAIRVADPEGKDANHPVQAVYKTVAQGSPETLDHLYQEIYKDSNSANDVDREERWQMIVHPNPEQAEKAGHSILSMKKSS